MGSALYVWGNYLKGLCNSDGSPSSLAQLIGQCAPEAISTHIWVGGCGYGVSRSSLNLTTKVVDYFHSLGTRVYAHICGTDGADPSPGAPCLENFYGGRTQKYVDDIIATGVPVDGISDGEVHNWDPNMHGLDLHNRMVKFFTEYGNYVHSHGLEVRFNTGTWYTFEGVMNTCDILAVEAQGVKFMQRQPWAQSYSPDRFAYSPISHGWVGSLDDAISLCQQGFDIGFGHVGIAYKTSRQELLCAFDTEPPPQPPPQPDCYEKTFIEYCSAKVGLAIGDPGFDEACDVDGSGYIETKDIAIMSAKICEEPTPPPTQQCLASAVLLAAGIYTQAQPLLNSIRSFRDRCLPKPLINGYYGLGGKILYGRCKGWSGR